MTLPRLDTRPLDLQSDDILLVTCLRNELLRLPYFLHYYRQLGVNRFLAIDNLSTDGSVDFLLSQPDVHLFRAQGSYSESRCGVDWINETLHCYACGHWALAVDIDELLVYSESESRNLQSLARSLEERHESALPCFMLDMYSDRPFLQTTYAQGSPFLLACPYFDATGYEVATKGPYVGLPTRGGMRQRLFWQGTNRRGRPPVLSKTPLVRWTAEHSYQASTHVLLPIGYSASSGILLHFKFFSDFAPRAHDEVARGEHWQDAAQYEAYADVFLETPGVSAWTPDSVRYKSTLQLEQLGLIRSLRT